MEFKVINKDINVGVIRVIGVASSSVLLIGDARCINLSSMADTPPESVSAIVPLAAER